MKSILLMMLFVLTSCSSLAMRPDDSAVETTAKVVSRVILAPATLGLSELRMYEIRLEERCAQQGFPYNRMAHDCWYGPSRPLSYGEGLAAAALIQGMNQGFQNMRVAPTPLYQLPTPAPIYTPPMRCTSNWIGSTVQTNCY